MRLRLRKPPNLRILVIEKYAFVNLPKLRYLSLSNNPALIHLGGKSFGHSIPNIKYLYLKNNAIEVLPGKQIQLSHCVGYIMRR